MQTRRMQTPPKRSKKRKKRTKVTKAKKAAPKKKAPKKKASLSMVCNGVLAGLVGITAGCDCVSIASSVIIGLVTSLLMCLSVNVLDKFFHIDDPVGAVSVHGVGGFVGTVLTGLLCDPAIDGVEVSLGVQTLGAAVVGAFAFVCGLVIFSLLNRTFGLRVDRRIEEEGLDVYEHGESAYN